MLSKKTNYNYVKQFLTWINHHIRWVQCQDDQSILFENATKFGMSNVFEIPVTVNDSLSWINNDLTTCHLTLLYLIPNYLVPELNIQYGSTLCGKLGEGNHSIKVATFHVSNVNVFTRCQQIIVSQISKRLIYFTKDF